MRSFKLYMIITLLRAYIIVVGLMSLILFQGHKYVRNMNCKLCFLDSCLDPCVLQFKFCMIATYIKKIMHNINCATLVLCSREIVYMFWVSQMSGLVRNFNIWIFSDTILCTECETLHDMVLHMELYLFITLSVTSTLFKGHSSVKPF